MAMEFQEFTILAVSALGFISLFKSSINLLRWVWIMFLRPQKNLMEYGSWAVITGATDGIGKAVAFELSSKGLNLILVGRNPSKIEATSREILERLLSDHNNAKRQVVEVKTVVVDLSKSSGREIADIIEKEIQGLDVGILINNAGLGYPYAEFFHEVDLELIESIMKVNMEAATWMALSVLPGMLKKKKGAIVNIGSASSVIPSYPLHTVYGASKAYLAMFSRHVSVEYKQSGIDIQCQIPIFFVATKMTKLKATSFFIPSPETYSKASVRSIGHENLCTPYWSHSVQWFLAKLLPDALFNWCLYFYFVRMNKREKLKKKCSDQNKKIQQQQ